MPRISTHPRLALAAACAAVLALSACEGSDLERGTMGAGLGAASAVVVGGSVARGAAIGAAAGILCDDLTPDLCTEN